jgi:hypothetical protein
MNPPQETASYPFIPSASSTVGTSGSDGNRVLLVTASPEFSTLDLWHSRKRGGKGNIDLLTEHVCERRRVSLIGNVVHLDASHGTKEFPARWLPEPLPAIQR